MYKLNGRRGSSCLPFLIEKNMNEASKLVSESLLGEDFLNIILNGKVYPVKAPSIKILCRAVKYWSAIGIEVENQTTTSLMHLMPLQKEAILKGLSMVIVGDCRFHSIKAKSVYRELERCTWTEILSATSGILETIGVESFFHCASLLGNATKMIAKPKS